MLLERINWQNITGNINVLPIYTHGAILCDSLNLTSLYLATLRETHAVTIRLHPVLSCITASIFPQAICVLICCSQTVF